jgi:predicted naringenin-chalcone synthase
MSSQPRYAYVNAVASAVPEHDVHTAFAEYARSLLPERMRTVFDRMAERSGIAHRWAPFEPHPDFNAPGAQGSGSWLDTSGFYRRGEFPATSARMALYEQHAPALAEQAVRRLDLAHDLAGVTHLVCASCTGFMAPGLDQVLAERLALMPGLERTFIGFMGCYAAVPALRAAHHIVRGEPDARVLVVNAELCSLHMREASDLETVLSFLLWGDGATAALVSAEPRGLRLHDFRSVALPDTADLITWRIGDSGFQMGLSGKVPLRIERALRDEEASNGADGILRGQRPDAFEYWAVHAGGRTVLDAVEQGLRLVPDALAHSRGILQDRGNMSSVTLMCVLERILAEPGEGEGIALAFGPGLCAETFRFRKLA